MKLRLFITAFALAAVVAFTACGSSQAPETASVSEKSEAAVSPVSDEGSAASSEVSSEETEDASEASSAAVSVSTEIPADEEEAETGAEASEALRPGLYHLVGMTQDGETMSTKDIVTMEDLGFEMYVQINEDGTGELNIYGENAAITWDEKAIIANDETIKYQYDGKYLTLAETDTSLTFSTMTAQEVIDAGEGVEGTMSFFEGEDAEGQDFSTEPTVDVKIVGADWIKNFEEKDILTVWFDVTNTSDDYIYASWDAYTTASQDGNTLEFGYVDPEEVPESGNIYRSIRPGVTLRCANTYAADKEGGPIQYKVTSGLYDTEILTAELDPANLQGPPADDFVLEKIEKIDWLGDAVESGAYGDSAEVAFKSSETVEDYQGNKLLRVWITYTNTGDEPSSFFMDANVRAVQDGISLDAGYISYDDPDSELKSREVEPGGSLDVCLDYELISDSPVSVEFVGNGDETFIAKAFDVK